jgi:hypothetical protein
VVTVSDDQPRPRASLTSARGGPTACTGNASVLMRCRQLTKCDGRRGGGREKQRHCRVYGWMHRDVTIENAAKQRIRPMRSIEPRENLLGVPLNRGLPRFARNSMQPWAQVLLVVELVAAFGRQSMRGDLSEARYGGTGGCLRDY